MLVPLARQWSVAAWAVLLSCSAPISRSGRAHEAAAELNLNARFGRMEVATEHVVPTERGAFSERHRGWGSSVRVADTELAGVHPISDSDTEVLVRVGWYRPEQQELRVTVVRQRWRDDGSRWLLVGEQRVEGDEGLFGEVATKESAPAPSKNRQFPTIRIGAP